jgi:hypothetical protein
MGARSLHKLLSFMTIVPIELSNIKVSKIEDVGPRCVVFQGTANMVSQYPYCNIIVIVITFELLFGQVALKSMMVIHRTLREGDPTFRDELLNYALNRGQVLNLSNFKDDSSPSGRLCSLVCATYHVLCINIYMRVYTGVGVCARVCAHICTLSKWSWP